MTHFPDQPHDGQQVVDELQEPPGYIRVWTYSEAKNEWTYKDYGPGGGGVVYTDQVLVRDNTEVPGMALADPSTLKTQKEVNYWLDEKASQGGGGGTPGKESLPWLQIDRWGMRKNPYFGNPIYEVRWSNNPNCTYTWQYEIDGDGDGNWIDIAEHPQKDELGFSPSNEHPIELSLAGSNQADILPNALMRFRLTGELNGVLSELSSGAIAAWEERMDEYDPPLYETGVAVDLDPYATTDYVDEKVGAYLPLTGGTIAGELRVNKPNDQPIFEVTEDKVLLQKHATNIQQLELKEIINVGILDNLMRDPGQYGYLKDYLLLAGGSMKGDIAMNGHQVTGLGTPKKDGQACTKGYVDEQIAGIEIPGAGGGGLPTTKYDGNRMFVVGNSVSALNNGEIVFTNTAGNIVDNVGLTTRIVLPIDEFNWDACSKSGFVWVKNGDSPRGYFQVYDVITNEGRNKTLKVKLFDFVAEDTSLSPGYGHSCYFNGVFFG